MVIRKADRFDIAAVTLLEQRILDQCVVSYNTIREIFETFPPGFLVAEEDHKVVGYVESCLFHNDFIFEKFEEIRNFPRLHDGKKGKTLYVIYLGVDKGKRSQGIGSQLIKSLQDVAREFSLDQMTLVAAPDLTGFYQRSGFEILRELPKFLPNKAGIFMRYNLR